MSNGLNYQSYLGEELPQWAGKTFGLKLDRETTTIAGQSMGGFAAIHTALAYPNKFGKCGVFSAPLALDEYLTGERPLAQIWRTLSLSPCGKIRFLVKMKRI